ncbi:MAG: type IV pilus assembly protein PilM [Actinomycetota bacterium]|nr:type IV pilus assembly protein PilM [Actinomycetota bacterium]
MVDWNKEIKFGRKEERAEEPEALDETQPLEPVEPPSPEPEAVELEPEDKAEKSSLLKKEISLSFRRKPKRPKLPKDKLDETEQQAEAATEKTARNKGTKRSLRRQGGAPKRAKRVVGLKIGASQLAAARIVNNGVPELVQVAREDLAPGLVVGGELREPELLADALRAFFRKHKLPRQGVRLGIANNRIGVRIFEIAGIDDPKALENAIRFRAQEALPIPIEEAVLDYHVLSERVDEEGHKVRRVLLVVAYRELIDRYVAACKKAGIRLAGIDLEAFALLRALGEPPADDDAPADAALVVVSVGHDRSTFAVSDGRVCEFTRVLDWGGQTLDVAIARELDMAPSEASPIKRELSLATANVPAGLTQEQADKAREAVRRQLQAFARELVSSLQFYQNQPGSLGIGDIVITGGTTGLVGLAEELQRLIGVRVAVGDPLTRVKMGRKVRETEQLGSLAVAIGLGIED